MSQSGPFCTSLCNTNQATQAARSAPLLTCATCRAWLVWGTPRCAASRHLCACAELFISLLFLGGSACGSTCAAVRAAHAMHGWRCQLELMAAAVGSVQQCAAREPARLQSVNLPVSVHSRNPSRTSAAGRQASCKEIQYTTSQPINSARASRSSDAQRLRHRQQGSHAALARGVTHDLCALGAVRKTSLRM